MLDDAQMRRDPQATAAVAVTLDDEKLEHTILHKKNMNKKLGTSEKYFLEF
jgi:hypothetical protein